MKLFLRRLTGRTFQWFRKNTASGSGKDTKAAIGTHGPPSERSGERKQGIHERRWHVTDIPGQCVVDKPGQDMGRDPAVKSGQRLSRLCGSPCSLDGAKKDDEVAAKPRGGLRGAVDASDVALRVDPAELDVFRRSSTV